MAKTTASSRIENLRSVPLFAGCSDASLKRILKAAMEFEAPAGRVLVQPKTPGSGLFVIEEGTVLVEAGAITRELGPGDFFGELSLLTDTERSARVRTSTAVRCLAISRFDFAKLLSTEPKLAVSLLEVLARRIAERTG